jgi:putative copper resistance protein D
VIEPHTTARDNASMDLAAPRVLLSGAVAAGFGLAVGLTLTGAADPLVLGDPGSLVRWGLPASRALSDLAGALTVGALLLAATALPRDSKALPFAVRVAVGAAALWTIAGAVTLVLSYADFAGRPLDDPQFGTELWTFVPDVELLRYLLIGVLMSAATATLAAGVRTVTGAGMVAAFAAAAWFPVALTGHAAAAADHETAVSGWWLHVLGICVWLGGLAALVLMRPRLGATLPTVAARYSTLAGWGFALVVVSGIANAWIRLERPADLLAGYGLLVLLKSLATLALGAAGWWHRRRVLHTLGTYAGQRGFWRLVAGELVLFGVTTGLAVALSRTVPPVPDELPTSDPTPAELMTGEPLPPPLSAAAWFTELRPDVLWVVIAAAAAVVYLTGVRRLRLRGDRWPVGRTVLWLLGCAALLYVTSGGPAVYGRLLFSAHMVQHMALSMVVPPLLVFGAPVTLALRALARRHDGSRGPREWLLWLIDSPPARLVSHPLVAAVLFAGSLVLFYFSPLFPLALRTHLGHELMMVHFLLTGYLFAQALVGIDPGPRRFGYPARLVLLFATMAFHAFFGVALVSGDTLLAATWFSSLGWGIDALADQQDGGAIAWGIGEFPTLVLAMVVAFQWSRSDDREARRIDRAADRDDDAELAAYNAMLRKMGGQEAGRQR